MTVVNPTPVFVRRGEDVRINCNATASPRATWFRRTYDWHVDDIYSNGVVAPNFTKQFEVVDDQHGRYDLIIKQIQLNDGGWYQCRDDNKGWNFCWDLTCSMEAVVSVYG